MESLYRVLDEISDMTRIPLLCERKAFEQNGVSLKMPVHFKATNITIRSLLEQVLKPFGLMLHDQPHYLVIGQAARSTEATRSRYAIGDICHDKAKIQSELLAPIQRLVAADSWANAQVETNDMTLVVQQTFDVHDQMVTWFEKLRVARGLPLQTKYDATQPVLRRFNPARYQVATEWAIAKNSLNKKVTAGFPRPEALSLILHHLQQQSSGNHHRSCGAR